jgi:HD-like signal output (HDOD) protein
MQTRKLANPSAPDAALAHDIARLRTLLPLRHLTDEEFEALAAHVEVEHRAPGQRLFRCGDDDGWLFYLLDGAASVADAGGDEFKITAGSIEALHPLSTHPKARVSAQAASDLRYVRLPAALTRQQPRVVGRPGIQVEELSDADDEVDSQLLFSIYHALREDRLELPTLPDIALKIRVAAEDQMKGVHEIAQLITVDPALASYCIRVANSAAYANGSAITNVRDAVTRMGIHATRDFVIAHAVRGLFNSTDPRCTTLMKAAWSHSSTIAALSFVIARRVSRINPEQALLAGLLHDIGVMVLISQLAQFPDLFKDTATLATALKDLKHQVTAMVLRAWRLPETLIKAAFAAEHWSREPGTEYELADILLLAHWHQQEPPCLWAESVPTGGIALLSKLPPEALTYSGRLQVVQEAADELSRVRALLGVG